MARLRDQSGATAAAAAPRLTHCGIRRMWRLRGTISALQRFNPLGHSLPQLEQLLHITRKGADVNDHILRSPIGKIRIAE